MYQALNLHLIAEESGLIEEVNKVKTIFANTIGDAHVRAERFKNNLIAAGSGVVFTQESDTFVPSALLKEGCSTPPKGRMRVTARSSF